MPGTIKLEGFDPRALTRDPQTSGHSCLGQSSWRASTLEPSQGTPKHQAIHAWDNQAGGLRPSSPHKGPPNIPKHQAIHAWDNQAGGLRPSSPHKGPPNIRPFMPGTIKLEGFDPRALTRDPQTSGHSCLGQSSWRASTLEPSQGTPKHQAKDVRPPGKNDLFPQGDVAKSGAPVFPKQKTSMFLSAAHGGQRNLRRTRCRPRGVLVWGAHHSL